MEISEPIYIYNVKVLIIILTLDDRRININNSIHFNIICIKERLPPNFIQNEYTYTIHQEKTGCAATSERCSGYAASVNSLLHMHIHISVCCG